MRASGLSLLRAMQISAGWR